MEDFGYLSAYSARVRHDTKWPDLLQNGRIQSAAASLIWFRLVLTDIISLKKKKKKSKSLRSGFESSCKALHNKGSKWQSL